METLLRAMLAVLVSERDERLFSKPIRRTEVLLVEAGLSIKDVSELTGKNYEAVKKAVQRARKQSAAEEE